MIFSPPNLSLLPSFLLEWLRLNHVNILYWFFYIDTKTKKTKCERKGWKEMRIWGIQLSMHEDFRLWKSQLSLSCLKDKSTPWKWSLLHLDFARIWSVVTSRKRSFLFGPSGDTICAMSIPCRIRDLNSTWTLQVEVGFFLFLCSLHSFSS